MPWVIREGKPVKVSVTVQRDVVVPKPTTVNVERSVRVSDGGSGAAPIPDSVDLEASIPVILEQVGDDAELAALAIEGERERDKPRSSLIKALNRIV